MFNFGVFSPGPGEQGKSVIIPTEEEAKKDELYKTNGFNAWASDKIALDRAVKDIRHEGYQYCSALWLLSDAEVYLMLFLQLQKKEVLRKPAQRQCHCSLPQ